MKSPFCRIYQVGVCLFFSLSLGCVTGDLKSKKVDFRAVARWDQTFGEDLAGRFESCLRFKKNTEVSVYLRKIANKLVYSTPELSGGGVGVWLIQDIDKKWHSFGLPGNRVYLSTGLLREVEYENEIAAAIAVQLAHIIDKSILKRLVKPVDLGIEETSATRAGLDPNDPLATSDFQTNARGLLLIQPRELSRKAEFFGLNGIFSFSDKMELSTIKTAVAILYRAGFDARGLIYLYGRYQNKLDHSPYEESTISKMIEEARKSIALYPPLRNPIVTTQDFLLLQKRIKHL